jgi:hypothetical protein
MSTEMHTSDANPGDVLIQLSYPSDNHGNRDAELTIRDQMSGQTVIKVRLSANELMDVMSTTGTHVGGATLAVHPERLGKRAQNVSTSLRHGDERTPEQVRDAYLKEGWESVRIDKTNYGHRVVAYRWIEDTPR